MNKIKKYYIKIGKENCAIKHENKINEFVLIDEENQETIGADGIGCFWSFENQMEKHFNKIDFKKKLFRKNVAYVGLCLNGSANSMKNIFTSFDHLDFDDVFLVHEHLALIQSCMSEDFKDDRCYLSLYIGSDRIDVCLVEQGQIIQKASMIFGKTVLDDLLLSNVTQEMLQIAITERVKAFLDVSTKMKEEIKVFIFGEKFLKIPSLSYSITDFGAELIKVDNYMEEILLGMENISKDTKKYSGLIYKRLTI